MTFCTNVIQLGTIEHISKVSLTSHNSSRQSKFCFCSWCMGAFFFKGDNICDFLFASKRESTLKGKKLLVEAYIPSFNPFALRMDKTLKSFGHSECNRVKS